jgi:V8-like Glu-specific endopeptidase
MKSMLAGRKYAHLPAYATAIWIALGSIPGAVAQTGVSQVQVDRRSDVVRVYPGHVTAPDPGADTASAAVARTEASGYQRIVDTSALPFAAIGRLDVVLLNGQRRSCTATAITTTAAVTSGSCLKPGRDIDGAIALEIRFTPGQTQMSSGSAPTAPSGTRSFYDYEMPTVFYDRSDLGPDYAVIFFREPLSNAAAVVDVSLDRAPALAKIVGYAGGAAGESGSLALWQADSSLSATSTRRVTYPLAYESGLSGAPVLELGSDGFYRLAGIVAEGTSSSLGATRLLASDATLFRRWLGLPPVDGAVQSGWWWVPSEAGRGMFIDISDSNLFLMMLGYGDDGRPTWHIASGAMASANSFQGSLVGYRGGAAFGTTYRRPAPAEVAGDVTLSFTSSRTAQLVTPWGTKSIERFPFVANGSVPDPAGPPYPESGVWWNADEPGTAVAVEVQGNTMMIGVLEYRSDERPGWTFAMNDMFLPLLFTGSLADVTDGPPNSQSWRPINGTTAAQEVIIEVKARDSILMLLSPSGARIPLTRYRP